MASVCQRRNLFLNNINNNFDQILDEILNKTKTLLSSNAHFHIQMPNRTSVKSGYYIRRLTNTRARGLYISITGNILLNEDVWCRKTIIHETLHALSKITHENFPLRYKDFLNEGFTELFTGYILWHLLNNCHEEWYENRLTYCSVSYERNVRLFYTFFRFVNIREGINYFFGSGRKQWKRRWKDLISSIARINNKKFRNPLHMRALEQNAIEDVFQQECERFFGPEFRRIYDTESKFLDYSLIKFHSSNRFSPLPKTILFM